MIRGGQVWLYCVLCRPKGLFLGFAANSLRHVPAIIQVRRRLSRIVQTVRAPNGVSLGIRRDRRLRGGGLPLF